MFTTILSIVILSTVIAVVMAIWALLWRGRKSSHEGRVALAAGGALFVWAVAATVLAAAGAFESRVGETIPQVGLNLVAALIALGLVLALSPSLKRLLSTPTGLIRLNVWRLVGVVFIVLMAQGELPALWAIPAGVGDVLVGAAAPWVARGLHLPGGRRRAILFNLFGVADLIVAVGLGIMISAGATRVIHVVPTAEIMTRFPLALVPAFLVPLALAVHGLSLWQLLGTSERDPSLRDALPEERSIPST